MLDMDNTEGASCLSEDDAEEFGYAELFERIWTEEELIFTIPEEDEERFKNGLAVAKTRFNKKMQLDGMGKEDRSFEYNIVKPCTVPGCINLQVSLKKKGRIKVFQIQKPDPSI